MKKQFKRLISILLAMVMVFGLLPMASFALSRESGDQARRVDTYTEAQNAEIEADVFAKIDALTTEASQTMGGRSRMKESDYIKLVPDVIEAIESSETYVPGTLQQNGNFLIWQTESGIPCCYDPRMEAELHNSMSDPSAEEIAAAEAEAEALVEFYESTRGGSPSSTKIGLIQPYW